MQHKLRYTVLSVATLGLCYLVSGCSSHYYKYDTPDITYNSVYLSLKVSETAIDSLKDVNTAYIYAYDKSGSRVTASSSRLPLLQKKSYTYSFFCPSTATNTTIDFFNANGEFIGCASSTLPELGKNQNENVDIDSVYNKQTAQSKYSFTVRERSAHLEVGGNVSLDAVLKTPVGDQIVTHNYCMDWSSSDVAVLYSNSDGDYTITGSGTANAIAEYNDVFEASRSYKIL